MCWSFFWGTVRQKLAAFCRTSHPVGTLLFFLSVSLRVCQIPAAGDSWVSTPHSHQRLESSSPPATSPSVFFAAHIHLRFPAKNCSQEAKHVSDRDQAQYSSWNQIILSHFINGNEQKFIVLVLMFLIQESIEKEMHLHHTGGASGSLLGHRFASHFQPARPVIY